MTDLDVAIRNVYERCLAVERGEQVVVVCDPASEDLAGRLRAAGERRGAEAILALISERRQAGSELPTTMAAAMAAADVVISPTTKSISHTTATRAALAGGARVASMPGVTSEMLARLMSSDFDEMRRLSQGVADVLTAGREARITCAKGSDLRLDLTGRAGIADTGEIRRAGAFGNLPCGEAYVPPQEGVAEGRLVVDGTITQIGRVVRPAVLDVSGGHLDAASGSAGRDLLSMLRQHGKDGTNLAELGVGTNAHARHCGRVIEDEKIVGTVHVAFGANAMMGGKVQVPIHIDCVVMEPTLEVDGSMVVEGGYVLV